MNARRPQGCALNRGKRDVLCREGVATMEDAPCPPGHGHRKLPTFLGTVHVHLARICGGSCVFKNLYTLLLSLVVTVFCGKVNLDRKWIRVGMCCSAKFQREEVLLPFHSPCPVPSAPPFPATCRGGGGGWPRLAAGPAHTQEGQGGRRAARAAGGRRCRGSETY